MKKPIAAALLLACAPFAASARDSLGGYTYLEAGFHRVGIERPLLGTDTFDFDGMQLRGSLELSENFYVHGGIAATSNSDLVNSMDSFEGNIGLGYKYNFGNTADFIAELGFQHLEIDTGLVTDNLDGARASVGVRGALGNSFEGWVKANYIDGSDYESEVTGTLGAQFIINETWGVVAEVEAGDIADHYLIGVRASF